MKVKNIIFLILFSAAAAALFCGEPQVRRVLVNGKWGAINSEGDIILDPEYDYLYQFHNGASVLYNGDYFEAKRAYVNADGNFISDFEFDRAYHFFGELAVVMVNGNEGYIDRQGNRVTEPIFSYAYDFKEGRAPVRIGPWDTKKMGVITADGSFAVKPVYDYLRTTKDPELFIVNHGDKKGAVDISGIEIIPVRYNFLLYKNGYFIAEEQDNGLKKRLILNNTGDTIFSDDTSLLWNFNGENIVFSVDNKYGVKDRDGNIIVKAVYDGLDLLPNGLIRVRSGSRYSGSYGLLDASGQILLPQVYRRIYDYDENGYAVVLSDSGLGVIDSNGEIIAPCRYSDIRPFSEGYAAVLKGGKWGFIDTRGKVVINITFDWVYDFSEGLAVFRVGDWETGKRGYIDKNGNTVIEPRFDWAYSFENGIAHVAFGNHYDGTFGYINKKGEYIWEPSN